MCTTFQFSQEQLDAICLSLYQARDGEQLSHLFSQLESSLACNWNSGVVQLGYTMHLLHTNQFDQLFDYITRGRFEERYFKELQEMWWAARYKENEVKRGKELGAVEKYRLRRKFPPPRSIWDGQETVYSFKENSRKYLKQYYKQNPYPSLEQKKEICKATELEIVQISNWFKNRRQRDKTAKEGSSSGGFRSPLSLSSPIPISDMGVGIQQHIHTLPYTLVHEYKFQ